MSIASRTHVKKTNATKCNVEIKMKKKKTCYNKRKGKTNEEFEGWYGVRKKIKNKKSTKRRQKGQQQQQRTGAVAVSWWFFSNSEHIFYLFRWRILPRSGGRRAWWGGCSGLGRPLLLCQGRESTRNFVKLIVQRLSKGQDRRLERFHRIDLIEYKYMIGIQIIREKSITRYVEL